MLLRALFPLTLMFAVLVALAQARPHDDADLRALLLPDGCPAPCWQGIRLGETRLNTAGAMMESELEPIERPDRYRGRLFGSPVSVALMTHPGVRGANPVVEMVRLRLPETSFGELQLALGQPDRVLAYTTPEHGYTPLMAVYSHYSLYVLVNMPTCALNQTTLWHTTRYVEIVVGNWLEYGSEYYLSSRELDMNTWATQLRGMARCDGQGYGWVETAGVFGAPGTH